MVRTAPAVVLLSWTVLSGCLTGTAAAQPPAPPPGANVPRGPGGIGMPGSPRGPNGPAAQPVSPPSTSGSSGLLRVMIPDAATTPPAPANPGTANPGTAGAPGPTPLGSGRPQFPSPGAGGAPKDPTEPLNAEIRAVLEGTSRDNAPPPTPVIPEMRVRARVFVTGQPPVAVVEIAGRQLTIREGSEIFVLGAVPPMQLRVTRMTTSEIRLEDVNKKQYFTLD